MAWCYWNMGTSTTSNTWPIWCGECDQMTASSTSIDTRTVWVKWNTGTATTNGATRGVWCKWNQGTHAYQPITVYRAPELTEEEKAAIQRQQEEAEALRKKEQAERRKANGRAASLLKQSLSHRQWRDYRDRGHFEVQSQSGRRYRIERRCQHGNVLELGANGNPVRRFCGQPTGFLPDADAHLAQKLFIETDEDTFRRIANATQLAVN